MRITEIRNSLIEKRLKVTPQRIAVLEAIIKLNNHPTADNIIDYIRNYHPNIALATVYKVLDALVANELTVRVKTEKDVMRYDAVMERHHHLYCSESDRIEDFVDTELNKMVEKYFKKKKIPYFEIEDIKLQIIGRFLNDNK